VLSTLDARNRAVFLGSFAPVGATNFSAAYSYQ
jgi:hypothetical protein